MYTHTPHPLRKPTFNLSDLLDPIGVFFVGLYDAFVLARRLQAAMEVAEHLKYHKKEYRNMSLGDIVQKIMDEK